MNEDVGERRRRVELREGNLLGPEGGTLPLPIALATRSQICDRRGGPTILWVQVAPVRECVSLPPVTNMVWKGDREVYPDVSSAQAFPTNHLL